MRTYPTFSTKHAAWLGILFCAVATAAVRPEAFAYGAGILFALVASRAYARLSTARLRTKGFELTWETRTLVHRVRQTKSFELAARIRNASDEPLTIVGLTPIASPNIDATLTPDEVSISARGEASIVFTVKGLRVGRAVLHGLTLKLRCSESPFDGLFETPLMFMSPLGIEIVPECDTKKRTHLPKHPQASLGDTRRFRRGDGDSFRELRDFQPGDPFRKIEWKASARRGRLVSKDTEQSEPLRVECFVSVGSEGFAGIVGQAPFDPLLGMAMQTLRGYANLGADVGLSLIASRPLIEIPCSHGPRHWETMLRACVSVASLHQDTRATRSDLLHIARDHLQAMDPSPIETEERLVAKLRTVRGRAPFCRTPSRAATLEEELALYIDSYQLQRPLHSGEIAGDEGIGALLSRRARASHQPNVICVYAWAPSRDLRSLGNTLLALARKGVAVYWLLPEFDDARGGQDGVERGVRARIRAEMTERIQWLAKHHVRVTHHHLVPFQPYQAAS